MSSDLTICHEVRSPARRLSLSLLVTLNYRQNRIASTRGTLEARITGFHLLAGLGSGIGDLRFDRGGIGWPIARGTGLTRCPVSTEVFG